MKQRIIFIPGNQSTHWSFAWSPWLKAELEKLGFETFFETFPDSIIARAEYWLPFLEEHIKVNENDILIGWSSGGTAAMRYAETHKVKGSILISPSYADLNDDLEKQSGWYDKPWDWDAIKKNQESLALFYGDNDEFIPQEDFTHIAANLSPHTVVVPGGGHFIEQMEFPEVIAYVKATYL
ncbi:alpha/beta hydrolase [soil metagenome]